MRKLAIGLLLSLAFIATPIAQNVGSVGTSSSLPGTCSVGTMTYLTSGSVGLYYCASTNTWGIIASPSVVTSGTDINSSGQVTATHLTAPLPVANGGTGVAVLPAVTMATPANQSGNATSTFKMNGLGCAITPVATGRVMFTITGSIGNNTTADSVTWKLAYGTGAAPSNAAALTGSILGATGVFKALTGQLDSPFTSIGLATGLALNTALWYDLQIADITGGTVTATAVTCTAVEM